MNRVEEQIVRAREVSARKGLRCVFLGAASVVRASCDAMLVCMRYGVGVSIPSVSLIRARTRPGRIGLFLVHIQMKEQIH